jgi:hypothetical protein
VPQGRWVWASRRTTEDYDLAVLRTGDVLLDVAHEGDSVGHDVVQCQVCVFLHLLCRIASSERGTLAEIAVLKGDGDSVGLLGPGIRNARILGTLNIVRFKFSLFQKATSNQT